jgi:hypothetical protein
MEWKQHDGHEGRIEIGKEWKSKDGRNGHWVEIIIG